jgi:protein-disulfide isomerase
MDKRFLSVLGVIIVLFVGIVVFNGQKKNSDNTKSSSTGNVTQHFKGNLSSKVTLQEYGDFECPVCENYYPTVQAVQEKYKDTVKFQFSNLPLIQIHPNAFAGARTAEAAGLQGKYWEMYDQLYQSTNWQEWSTSSNPVPYFKSYAQALGLDYTKFQKDFASSAVNDTINADISAFKKTGVSMGTPSFFINGKNHPNSEFVDPTTGAPSVEAFSKVLDAALKTAK